MTVATWEDVVVVVVHEEMTHEGLAASLRANRSLVARYPAGVGALSVARIGIKLPDAALRQAASESIAATRDSVLCAAQVLPGEGFFASAIRSVMLAIEMLRPDQRPRRTFGELDKAAAWMAQHMHHDAHWAARLEHVANSLVRAQGAAASAST